MKSTTVQVNAILLSVLVLSGIPASSHAGTTVPGHSGSRVDRDGNGIPDVGVVVNGHFDSLYAYDDFGDYYYDVGDGRILGTVASVDELDQGTLTECTYVNNYRGTFQNTPYMDSGWIQNHVNCTGFDDNGTYNYTIVHNTDPRYTGDPAFAIWGSWEYHTYTESKSGNLARPANHTGN